MLKKLLANKKMLILIVALALVIVGTLIAALTSKDSKEDGKSGISIETEANDKKDSETSDDNTDEVYNGEGLEVQDTLDESVYTIDGSGDWDGSSNDGSKKEQGNKTDDAQSNDKQSDDTQSDDTEKEESNDKGDDGELDNDILVDDKVWGQIS